MALLTTQLPGLMPSSSGKVRELYDLGAELLIVTTDRISAFDVIMANGIPDKGRVLNQMSAFWFHHLRQISDHHVISTDDAVIAQRLGHNEPSLHGRCTLAKKTKPLNIECVARGYIAGSLYKEYRIDGGKVHGLDLPEGLLESSRLPEPIFTPATKATEGHDMNLSWQQSVDIVGLEVAEKVRDLTLQLYSEAATHALKQGLILADTKFEFGLCDEGVLWIDEALTPDSSRFWDLSSYKPGGPQPSYDKQFVRDYLESIHWDKRPPGPTLPEDVVDKTRGKYLQAYRLITGARLDAG
jgi:phosphoribosylaminoimidazole-succinocarboxamide synthase